MNLNKPQGLIRSCSDSDTVYMFADDTQVYLSVPKSAVAKQQD